MKLNLLHEADVHRRGLERKRSRGEASPVQIAVDDLRSGVGPSPEMIKLAAKLGHPLAIRIMREFFEEEPAPGKLGQLGMANSHSYDTLKNLEKLVGKEGILYPIAQLFQKAAGPDHEGAQELEKAAQAVRTFNAEEAEKLSTPLRNLSQPGPDPYTHDLPVFAALMVLQAITKPNTFMGKIHYSLLVLSGRAGTGYGETLGLDEINRAFADRLMTSKRLPRPYEGSGEPIPDELGGQLY